MESVDRLYDAPSVKDKSVLITAIKFILARACQVYVSIKYDCLFS